jgi:hypothetical protein
VRGRASNTPAGGRPVRAGDSRHRISRAMSDPARAVRPSVGLPAVPLRPLPRSLPYVVPRTRTTWRVAQSGGLPRGAFCHLDCGTSVPLCQRPAGAPQNPASPGSAGSESGPSAGSGSPHPGRERPPRAQSRGGAEAPHSIVACRSPSTGPRPTTGRIALRLRSG